MPLGTVIATSVSRRSRRLDLLHPFLPRGPLRSSAFLMPKAVGLPPHFVLSPKSKTQGGVSITGLVRFIRCRLATVRCPHVRPTGWCPCLIGLIAPGMIARLLTESFPRALSLGPATIHAFECSSSWSLARLQLAVAIGSGACFRVFVSMVGVSQW